MAIKHLDSKRIRGSSTAGEVLKKYTIATDYSTTVSATNLASDNTDWVTSDSTNSEVSSDRLNFQMDSSEDVVYYDLQNSNALGSGNNASDTAWVLRWTHNNTSKGTDCFGYIGLSSTTTNAGEDQDQIAFYIKHVSTSSEKKYGCHDVEGSDPDSTSMGNANGWDPSSGYTYYFELTRTSATAYAIRKYTDSDYDTLDQPEITGSCAATLNNLRYIKLSVDASTDSTMEFKFDDVKFWNGVTSSTTAEPADANIAGTDEKAALVTPAVTAGNAWQLNGGKITLSHQMLPTGTSPWSIAMWFKFDDISQVGEIIRNESGSPHFELWQNPSHGIRQTVDGGGNTIVKAQGSLANNTWYHLVITNDDDDLKFYWNGSYQSANDETSPTIASVTTWYLGGRSSGAEDFNGQFGQFLVYSTALNQAAITALYNSGVGTKSPSTTNLTTHYDFEETSGTTLDDKVGSNNGSLGGSADLTNDGCFASPASSDLPENTLFEETDTYKTYWLQSNVWAINPAPWSTAGSSAFICGGSTSGSGTPTTAAQQYNGSTWSDMSSIPSAYTLGIGGGNATDGFAAGGSDSVSGNMGTNPINTNYLWNGSSWSTGNNLSASRNMGAGGGNTSSALIWGGTYSQLNSSDEFDGTNWSAGGNLLSGTGLRGMNGDAENNSSGFSVAGYDGSSSTTTTQQYDGTSWTAATAAIGSSSVQGSHGGCGEKTNFLSATSSTSAGAIDHYNGTTWSTTASTVGDRRSIYGGNGTKAFKATGDNVGDTHSEYYNGTTWASTGNMETSVRQPKGAGGNT